MILCTDPAVRGIIQLERFTSFLFILFASGVATIKLSVDAELQARLTQAGGPIELCDQSGRTIKFFQPTPPGTLKEMSPYSDEEIQRFAKQQQGRPLAEIWNDLQSTHGS